MVELGKLAKIVRSKNAGPFVMTIDVMFTNKDTYDKVLATNILNATFFSELYHTPEDKIQIYHYEIAFAIKISMPRPYFQGDLDDGDNYAGQQYGPLVLLDLPV
jgi:hypothetical protein